MKEKWIQINDTNYSVSNLGNVRNDKTGTMLKGFISNTGYRQVMIPFKNGEKPTNYLVHRLVGYFFLANPNTLPYINHKDEDKLNNSVDNLEWCNPLYNVRYSRERHGEEYKERLSNSLKTESARKKMSESAKARCKKINNNKKFSKIVLSKDDKEYTFKNMKEAADFLSIPVTTLFYYDRRYGEYDDYRIIKYVYHYFTVSKDNKIIEFNSLKDLRQFYKINITSYKEYIDSIDCVLLRKEFKYTEEEEDGRNDN